MFKDIGNNLQVYCDYEGCVLRIASTEPLLPDFLGTFREIAQFKSREGWVKSSFFHQVTNEDIQDMIEWFWEDLRHEAQVSQ